MEPDGVDAAAARELPEADVADRQQIVSWLRSRCPGRCSPRSCAGSTGSDHGHRRSRHEHREQRSSATRRARCVHDRPRTAERSPDARAPPKKLRLRHLPARANPRSGPFRLAWRMQRAELALKPASGDLWTPPVQGCCCGGNELRCVNLSGLSLERSLLAMMEVARLRLTNPTAWSAIPRSRFRRRGPSRYAIINRLASRRSIVFQCPAHAIR